MELLDVVVIDGLARLGRTAPHGSFDQTFRTNPSASPGLPSLRWQATFHPELFVQPRREAAISAMEDGVLQYNWELRA